MRVAWSPAQEIKFQHIEGNLFTVQCSCLGDWQKVEKGGPWLFRQSVVCIEPYDGFTDPDSIDLNFFTTWVQIQKLQIGYRSEALITNLMEKKVGQVEEIQTNVQGAGNFVRVKVKLDVRKVLERFVSMVRDGKREIFILKYEKMPRFCAACGFIGHSHLECGSGEYAEKDLKWGDWMKADWDTWYTRVAPAGRGGGNSTRGGRFPQARGGGRGPNQSGRENNTGHGNFTSWRHNALAYVDNMAVTDPALKDTATSPLKGKEMDIDSEGNPISGTKRNIADQFSEEGGLMIAGASGAELGASLPGVPPPGEDLSNGKDDEVNINKPKRTKMDGANSSSLGSASSQEGLVRSQ
jgi:hypothetical protein